MPLSLFERLVPHFSGARFVHLQGWGEPMLSPHLWDMIAMAKAEGPSVGFTTGGMLLTDRAIDRLMESGADYVSISIAGAVQATHGALRVRSDIERIFDRIRRMAALKRRSASHRPRISVSYMMTTANIEELPAALARAIEAGADDFYATNLDCVFSASADRSRIFVWEGEPAVGHLAILDRARSIAAENNFSFRPYPLIAQEQPACELDPSRIMFITAAGEVCPCPYLSRPDNRRIHKGREYLYRQLNFGNIADLDLTAVWKGRSYAEFRKRFERRREADRRLRAYMDGGEPFDAMGALNPPPLHGVCETCAKAYGV